MGDRLTQNGVNYTLDLNSDLTQVLSDGTNTYLYGAGRIAQVNTTTLATEYFMTDALGSVRQLTDSQGEITLANAYDPYGTRAQTAGSAQTSYGFTGEFADPSGMVYLRARYYMPDDGRFLTRDTWMGEYDNPLSLNRWMYGYGNPVKYTDSSGNSPGYSDCVHTFPLNRINVDYADKNVNLSKSDWLNTYTAAGIAVQCWADILPVKFWEDGGHRSGQGDAQISDRHAETAYGQTIVGNGFGVRCYIPIGPNKTRPCPICVLPWEVKRINAQQNDQNYFASKYKLESIQDQKDITWATIYMRRRIKAVVDSCRGKCTSTDLFIAAALAQGAAISPSEMYNNVSNSSKLDPNAPLYVIPLDSRGVTINWLKYFQTWGDAHATSMEVDRFASAVQGLGQKGWLVPSDLNWNYIRTVRYWIPATRRPR